jgi:transcriptional regulator with XRE-family HTH domain
MLGWSQEETAQRLSYRSVSAVSKIESGSQGVTIQQLPFFFEVYGITDDHVREWMRDLVRRADEPDWWETYGPGGRLLGDYLGHVETATKLFVWNPAAIPGLLQIEGYARAVAASDPIWRDKEDIDRWVAIRLEHQRLTFERETPLHLHAVMPEGLLRQQVGGRASAHAQLQHLIEMADHQTVTIQVLPFSAGAHAGMNGSFQILDYPGDEAGSVIVESLGGQLHHTEPDSMALYRATAERLKSQALPESETRHTLTLIAEDMR